MLTLIKPVVLSLGALFTANELELEPMLDGMRDLISSKKANVHKLIDDDDSTPTPQKIIGLTDEEEAERVANMKASEPGDPWAEPPKTKEEAEKRARLNAFYDNLIVEDEKWLAKQDELWKT